ncbi:MAG: ribonuclease P protein component [Syntrophothermus sp.]
MVCLVRLKRPDDFRRVYAHGTSYVHKVIVLYVLPSGKGLSRIGLVVSKKIGKAVVRNKIKRRLRAITDSAQITGGFDLVVVARGRAREATFGALQEAFSLLARKAGIWVDGEDTPVRAKEDE